MTNLKNRSKREEIILQIDMITEALREKTTQFMHDVPFKLMFERAELHRRRNDLMNQLAYFPAL